LIGRKPRQHLRLRRPSLLPRRRAPRRPLVPAAPLPLGPGIRR